MPELVDLAISKAIKRKELDVNVM